MVTRPAGPGLPSPEEPPALAVTNPGVDNTISIVGMRRSKVVNIMPVGKDRGCMLFLE
ncbi:MAG: hypothetical protein IMZ62_00510 [Chloroflexi bacterium]|nr:hypothetical protein [Chloroflexota bacterium]